MRFWWKLSDALLQDWLKGCLRIVILIVGSSLVIRVICFCLLLFGHLLLLFTSAAKCIIIHKCFKYPHPKDFNSQDIFCPIDVFDVSFQRKVKWGNALIIRSCWDANIEKSAKNTSRNQQKNTSRNQLHWRWRHQSTHLLCPYFASQSITVMVRQIYISDFLVVDWSMIYSTMKRRQNHNSDDDDVNYTGSDNAVIM